MLINNFNSFVFDLDGTIYRGEKLIPGAQEVIGKIKDLNKSYVFLTNKPLNHRKTYAQKLTNLGIPAQSKNIITSSYVTANYLSSRSTSKICYVIGEDPLKEELLEKDIKLSSNIEEVNCLVVSFDRNFHYEKLNKALQIIKTGAEFIATNPDKTCPVDNGEIPDAGGIIAAIEAVTDKKVEKVLGKPSKEMLTTALQQLGNPAPEECLMVGDRLETDIVMGNKYNLATALVMSGVTTERKIKRTDTRPDYILESVADLI